MKKLMLFLLSCLFVSGCYFPWGDEDEERPAAPSNLEATIETNNQGIRFVRLHWKDNSNNETGFKIARSVGTGMYWVIQTVGANSTSYDDFPPDTNYGTSYSYRVRSVTNYYGSEYSNEVMLTFM